MVVSLHFSTAGGMGPAATIVYKRIADMLSQKYDQPYSIGSGAD